MEDFMMRFAEPKSSVSGPTDFPFKWNTWYQGLIVGLLSIGAIVGSLMGGPLSDRWGRRLGIFVGCIIMEIGLLIQVASVSSWVQFAIGRLVTGVAIGWLSGTVPLYQSETVPRQVRGALVGTFQLLITIGILLSYLTCYGTRYYSKSGALKYPMWTKSPTQEGRNPSSAEWRVPIGLGFAWTLILGIGIWFCPESPRWLGRHERYEEMMGVLANMRGVERTEPYVMTEFYDIKQEILAEQQVREKGWLDCFRWENKTLYRTALGMLIQTGQQLTGANYFFYFGATIFQSVGISDSYITQIILGAVNVLTTFPGLWALDRFGRRTCLLIGAAWMTAWLIVFATAGVVGKPTAFDLPNNPPNPAHTDSYNHSIGTLMVCAACFYILAFASTWGPGAWIAIAEFCAPDTRAKQFALATMCNWIWNFCIGFFTPPITGDINFYYGYIFVGCNFANFLLIYFFLYETSNLTLEAVNDMYLDPNVNAINSSKWVPEGYTSRHGVKEDVENKVREVGGTAALPDPEMMSKNTNNLHTKDQDL
ncbi:hypothetical protein MYAM1_001477 [Malassezia yamatoensis]|uniref:Major facilitator superfamily (MFS) profile domain-containing protein n=1 Tax=Malassezia yamatoensis TaxID=253288 RepID=A0AAJ5YRE9_9BASI|nr:hypothetical protein MYAM1_001477 [Malassezia yamatoensis]